MRVTGRVRSAWGDANGVDRRRACHAPGAVLRDQAAAAPWPARVALDSASAHDWDAAGPVDAAAAVPWGHFSRRVAMPAGSLWTIADPVDAAAAAPWGQFSRRVAMPAWSLWTIADPVDAAAAAPWGQFSRRVAMPALWLVPASAPVDAWRIIPWGESSRRVDGGIESPTDFDDSPIQAAIVIPTLRTYIVAHDITLRRVADDHAFEALSLSLSIDADSWVWGFSASLPGSDLDDVVGDPGEPVELEAVVNGFSFRLLAERVARSRQFGQARVSISGRGIAAVLDAPYAPVLSLSSVDAITAQQAATAAIQHVSLPLGWSLDWQITDWLLPAGLWTHQGSPISAVQRIATAAGAYVQADAESKTLRILPRYPVAPWDWAGETPDIEVPAAACVTESIEWADKPDYNAVYVSGAAGGILARVKRTGTAGDILAQMATDDLTTHTDAASQRGIAILADTGRQARQSITLPILDPGGILLPGTLAQFTDGSVTRLGLVRGVSIQTGVRVRQTVEIETHE